MKPSIFKLMAAVTVCAVAVVTTSCENTPIVKPDPIVKDTSAGTFIVKNLSTQATIGQSAEIINRDTILIAFKPNQEYINSTFTIICNGLERVNDSIYVLPKDYLNSGVTTDGNTITAHNPKDLPDVIEVNILASDTITTTSDSESYYIIKAESSFKLNVAKSYVIIPLKVNLSPDLKSFVDVELSYTDKDGNEQKYLIKEEEWVKPDSVTLFEYETEEGETNFGYVVPDGCKIIEEERFARDCYYVLNTRFLNLENDVTTTFSARYIPKPDIEIDRENYTFKHGIDRMSASISIPGTIVIDNYISFNISIDIHIGMGTDDISTPEETKEKVRSYLEELSNTPDIKKFNISKTGLITSVE